MFHIIVAYSKKNRGIGFNNNIPWRRPKYDMQYFKNITLSMPENNTQFYEQCFKNIASPISNNSVIMGRKTWESLKCKSLKDRHNIIISNTLKNTKDNNNIKICNSYKSAIEYAKNNFSHNFIIGGEEIYELALHDPIIQTIYVTEICTNHNYLFDTYFPMIPNMFKLWKIKEIDDNKLTHIPLTIKIYKNNKKFYNIKFDEKAGYIDNVEEMQYIKIIQKILNCGKLAKGRNGNTLTIFGENMNFNLTDSFPLLTTKKMFTRGVIEELLFFMRGHTDTNILEQKNINIWKKNTSREFLDSLNLKYKERDLGPIYGFNWRHYGAKYEGYHNNKYDNQGFDQLQYLINELIDNPHSRRHLLTTYDAGRNLNPDNFESVLTPCHGISIQFYVRDKKYLDCSMYQRSCDVALGLPFNITSYALLVYIIANMTNYQPGNLIMNFGDCHIYEEHIDNICKHLNRKPFSFPKLKLVDMPPNFITDRDNKLNVLDDYLRKLDTKNFKLINYCHHENINMDMIA
jgi:dihydrofolate reductase/thymidylate synthase